MKNRIEEKERAYFGNRRTVRLGLAFAIPSLDHERSNGFGFRLVESRTGKIDVVSKNRIIERAGGNLLDATTKTLETATRTNARARLATTKSAKSMFFSAFATLGGS